jgi:hypothetical protein
MGESKVRFTEQELKLPTATKLVQETVLIRVTRDS